MEVQIQMDGKFTFTVQGVTHPTHAVNRLSKYLNQNTFAVERVLQGIGVYIPVSPITIQFDEMDLARRVDIDDVVEPTVWFDLGDRATIERSLRRHPELRRKVEQLISENNPF